jgi:uncharacterized membrane protein
MYKSGRLFFYRVNVMLLPLYFSCTKDKGASANGGPAPAPAPASIVCQARYTSDIKPFVLVKCAASGCHRPGFPFGDFTTYTDLKIKISSGRVKTLVFDEQLMPPAGAIQLTKAERDQLKCWIDNGAAED